MKRIVKVLDALSYDALETELNKFFAENDSPRWHLVSIASVPYTHTVANWTAWLEYENDD